MLNIWSALHVPLLQCKVSYSTTLLMVKLPMNTWLPCHACTLHSSAQSCIAWSWFTLLSCTVSQITFFFCTIRCSALHMMSDIIALNVGGKCFNVAKQTLLSVPDTFFTGLLSDAFAVSQSAELFVDVDLQYFEYVLEYLRHRVLPDSSCPHLAGI